MLDATTVWHNNLRNILLNGDHVAPRGINTTEILAYQSTVHMSRPVVISETRKLGYKFMAAEAAWILSGDNRVSIISPFSKEISRFSDDGVSFFGAYGPRIVDQLMYVVQALAYDPETRQAVMTIWRPNPPKTKDVPCTTQVQWFIRDDVLHCIDTMRSSDLWLGWPYDIFNFSMLSGVIALRLKTAYNIDVELGNLTLVAGSQHLYEQNWEAARACVESRFKDKNEGPLFNPHQFFNEEHLIGKLWQMARNGKGALDL